MAEDSTPSPLRADARELSAEFVASLTAGDTVYISGDEQVTVVDTTVANLRKTIGIVKYTVTLAKEPMVTIITPFRYALAVTAKGTLTAGDVAVPSDVTANTWVASTVLDAPASYVEATLQIELDKLNLNRTLGGAGVVWSGATDGNEAWLLF